eukprot:1192082-Prorocentrum_minimum.AAC.2
MRYSPQEVSRAAKYKERRRSREEEARGGKDLSRAAKYEERRRQKDAEREAEEQAKEEEAAKASEEKAKEEAAEYDKWKDMFSVQDEGTVEDTIAQASPTRPTRWWYDKRSNVTLCYGSSCANNGKSALNTPVINVMYIRVRQVEGRVLRAGRGHRRGHRRAG